MPEEQVNEEVLPVDPEAEAQAVEEQAQLAEVEAAAQAAEADEPKVLDEPLETLVSDSEDVG